MPLKPISTVPSDLTKTGVILSPPDRFSISFNTFPSGNVNGGGWGQSMVNIKVEQAWDDLGPLDLKSYVKEN